MQTKFEKDRVEEIMSLTSLQEGMLFHYLMKPDSPEYHEQISVLLKGDINPSLLQKAWDFVIENNEMLRTVFRWKEIDKPVQIVLKKHKVTMQQHDFSREDARKLIEKLKQTDLASRIDLERETLRIYLCKCSKEKSTMIVSNHHILYDGWSSALIIKELLNTYRAFYQGIEPELIFKTKFKEYLKWLQSRDKIKQKSYWQNYLKGIGQNDTLFSKAELSGSKSHKRLLDKALSDKLKEFAKKNRISVAVLIYCAWGLLLQRLNNTNDILFGATSSGRNQYFKGIENTVGLFINTIPIRIETDGEEKIIHFLKKLDKEIKEGSEFEVTPLVEIKEYADLNNDSQIFNSLLVIENYPLESAGSHNEILAIENYSARERTNYNLTLQITVLDQIGLDFQYNCFSDPEMIRRIGQYFETVITAIIANKNNRIAEIELLSAKERERILNEFNATAAAYPQGKTIQQLFEEQAARLPDKVALVFEGKTLSYAELNAKANRLARLLRAKGVGPDVIVGIMAERSFEMLSGILGILKAGGAYLPIDPDYPKDRIGFMLKDSSAKIVLTQSHLAGRVEFAGEKINLEEIGAAGEAADLAAVNSSGDLAYLIYTSGSSGKPKGVMVEHESVVNLLYDMERHYPLAKDDAYLLKTTYTFDVSVPELFGWFLAGEKLVILPPKEEKLAEKISQAIADYQISHIYFVPSTLQSFLEAIKAEDKAKLKSLKYLFTIGEALKQETVNSFYAQIKNAKLENVYGPAEATVYDSRYPTLRGAKNPAVPIGKPVSNIKLYITDKQRNLQPIGIAGELCISGIGLARGYLNRPELTEEKFPANPFGAGRIYCTGDLARWLPDGNIEFLGRMDQQVKIRGFRIEPGEIESRLLELGSVKEAAVIAGEDKTGDKYLCAYIVTKEDIPVAEIKRHLAQSLPEYMIPSFFKRLDKLPLTSSGKVAKKELPLPDAGLGTGYQEPRSEAEAALAGIWAEVLGREKVGIYDNFFELGGHSLKGTSLVSRIRKKLGAEVPLSELFRNPTVAGIGAYIASVGKSASFAIEAAEEKEYYEASSAQMRMWLLQQLAPDSTGYNMTGVVVIEGALNRERLRAVLSELIMRHESLRTSFTTEGDLIMQRIAGSVDFEMAYIESAEAEIDEVIADLVRPFDLSRAPLLRASLIKTSKDRHYLLLDLHHIIADGISMEILRREFMALSAGQKLVKQRIQYKDFSEWQNQFLKTEQLKQEERYWLERFSGEIPLLNLPLDYPRPAVQEFAGDCLEIALGPELKEKLRALTRKSGATLYLVLLSALNILLAKYTGQDDIIIGSPIAGRPHADLENSIGMFVNTLALRNYPASAKSYSEFLNEVKDNALKAYENQEYQFEELVEKLDLRRDLSRNPLFDIMFGLQNEETIELQLEDLAFKNYELKRKAVKFDLEFTAQERKEDILIRIGYRTSLFKRETVERLGGHFVNLLQIIGQDKSVLLGEIGILSAREQKRILYEFNATASEYPRDKTIAQLFEEQVERTPDNAALLFDGKCMSYAELNAKSNRLARVLRTKGVKADSIVGIMAERSFELIIGILGILKSGGAYLPIDPVYPKGRIAFMLEDSGIKLLLTQIDLHPNSGFEGEVLELDDALLYAGVSQSNLEAISQSGDLAYVIYTSGSTGQPKGVMIEHKSLINYCSSQISRLGINQLDRSLQTATITFDMSVEQIFTTLLAGASLYLIDKDLLLDQDKFNLFMRENSISYLHAVPALLENLDPEGINQLKRIVSGGELCTKRLVKRLTRGNGCEFYNSYGPTEATIISTMYLVCPDEIERDIPIGKPISNFKLYIMNRDQQLSPIGVAGELGISGIGLARGYLNRPELTAEKFGENPFLPGERIYRTGDLARWLPDGNIEFLGRIDQQVKIRGFRIEPGEIESRLLEIEEIKEAVVVAREDGSGDRYLCAYIAAKEDLPAKELREHLAQSLPDYMIPSYFVRLAELPLTPSKKVDQKALPAPASSLREREYEAPRNKMEEKMAEIWSRVLALEQIGIHDNFFELGGHSLKGTVLSSRIHKELNVRLPLKELFQAPTIAGICAYLSRAQTSAYASIAVAQEKEFYAVSSAQKRMYVLQQLDPDSVNYHIPLIMKVEGALVKEKLEKAIRKLIERHQVLRTTFEAKGDQIIQRIREKVDFAPEYGEVQAESLAEAINNFIRPFDLAKAPLLRIAVLKQEEERHLLLFDIHHIIADGTSMSVLTREFAQLYAGREIKAQRIQYKDFSQWQNAYLQSDDLREQEQYWLEKFSGEIPVLNLPLDYPRPAVQEFAGDRLELAIGKELKAKLDLIRQKSGATLYMVLLSAVYILLFKYTGQEDIIIGGPIAGRPHPDLEDMLGMFVNTLALRNYPASGKSYAEFLSEVKENALKAYANQEYQFEELVEKLDLRRDMSRNPLFDVMFALQNGETSELEVENLRFSNYERESKTVKFDLEITAREGKEEILISIGYCTSLFKRETIERLGGHFLNLLQSITQEQSVFLAEIEILSEREQKKILYEFNETKAVYPQDKTLAQLFEEQAERTPDQTALVFEGQSMSYAELNVKANRLARVLKAKGVKADLIVGIMAERSFELIIGILAILKAGGAYLPIDPEYPKERIRYILADSKTGILLTHSDLPGGEVFAGEILKLDGGAWDAGENSNLKNPDHADKLAYVIYTSGSTGNPKGTLIEHRSVVNYCTGQIKRLGINASDRALQFSSISFDMSVEQIFTAILSGASLYLINKDVLLDHNKFNTFLKDNAITYLHTAPSLLDNLNEDGLAHLTKIVSGGALCTAPLVKRLLKGKNCQFYNSCGATEATVISTMYPVEPKEIGTSLPIGKPINNCQVYIINQDRKIVPIKVAGELCYSGVGLARGYLNRPELTAEKFVPNPFLPGERMYRTGDLARWLPDGNIEFLGRIDNQVKIRGFRIELGEIENRLRAIEAVREAAVIAFADGSGDNYLCAYLVSGQELSLKELREDLAASLPDYMIPSYFIRLAELPLTPNGKIDRKALPKPAGNIGENAEYIAPRTEEERVVAAVFSEILGREKAGALDDFFLLGGDSIKAIRIVSKLREAGYELSVKDLMTNTTVEQSGRMLKKRADEIRYEQGEVRGEAPLTPVQKWFLGSDFSKPDHFNQSLILKSTVRLEKAMISSVLEAMVRHHDILRAVYRSGRQEILNYKNGAGYELREYDYRSAGLTDAELAKDIEAKNNKLQASIDIAAGPLVKAGLFRTKEADHLMLCIHHLAVDGVSWRIFLEDLEIGCKQYLAGTKIKFSEKTASYRAWGSALEEYGKSDLLKHELPYWREIAKTRDEGRIQKAATGEEGFGRTSLVLKKEETEKLLFQSAKAFGTEINDLLLSGLGLAVFNLTGQRKMSLNLEGHGREMIHKRIDIDRTIGWFASVYPVVIELSDNIRDMIINTKEMLRQIPGKGLGYGVLKYLAKEAFEQEEAEVTFNYLGSIDAEMDVHALFVASPYSKGREVAEANLQKEMLSLNCIIADGKLRIDISYRKDKFTDEEANRLGELYQAALTKIIDTCVAQIRPTKTLSDFKLSADADLISQAELDELLNEFN